MRFQAVTLTTSALEACRTFYESVLELPQAPGEGPGFAVQAGHTRLLFVPGAPATYHFAFNIPENQHLLARDWLRERTPLIEYEGRDIVDFPNWNAHSIYFFDPAGNIVELIARHNLENGSLKPFGSQSLLSVSEVGVPVPEVSSLLDTLESQWDEPLWSGNREKFAAAGDEEGLLIVVNPGRHWFPTELSSGMFPLEVGVYKPGKMALSGVPEAYRFRAV